MNGTELAMLDWKWAAATYSPEFSQLLANSTSLEEYWPCLQRGNTGEVKGCGEVGRGGEFDDWNDTARKFSASLRTQTGLKKCASP